MAKPLSKVFKEMQEREDRINAKINLAKQVEEEFYKVTAENAKVEKQINDLQLEDKRLLDLIAKDKTELVSLQIENKVLSTQIENEEKLTIQLKEKLASLERQEMEAINKCQKVVSEYYKKFGINGSCIQEKIYRDEENERELKELQKEKERIVANIIELKKKEEQCRELETKKIELLKTLDSKHKERITLEKDIQSINDEILGLQKTMEAREMKRKFEGTKKAIVETRIETLTVVNTEKTILKPCTSKPGTSKPGISKPGTLQLGTSKADCCKRQRAAKQNETRSASLDRWFRPQRCNWLVLPKQEAKSIEVPAPHKKKEEIPDTKGLAVPPLVAQRSNETMLEIAENYNINDAPPFMRAFLREMSGSRNTGNQNKKA